MWELFFKNVLSAPFSFSSGTSFMYMLVHLVFQWTLTFCLFFFSQNLSHCSCKVSGRPPQWLLHRPTNDSGCGGHLPRHPTWSPSSIIVTYGRSVAAAQGVLSFL